MTESNFIVKNGIVVNNTVTANSTSFNANGFSVNATAIYANKRIIANTSSGVSGPESIIIVGRTADDTSAIEFRNSDNTTVVGRLRTSNIDLDADLDLVLSASGNSNLYLQAGEQTRIFISNTGNVGINTTSPSSSFHVAGNSQLLNITTNNIIANTSINVGSVSINTSTLFVGSQTLNSTVLKVGALTVNSTIANSGSVNIGNGTQQIAVSPIANPTWLDLEPVPLYDTYSSLVVQANTRSGLNNRQWAGVFGLTSSSGNSATGFNNHNVTLYAGIDMIANSGDGWAFNTVTTINPEVYTDRIAYGYELDFNNLNSDRDTFDKPFYGLAITGVDGGYRSTAAVGVFGPFSKAIWNYGYVALVNSCYTATFLDQTNSKTSILIEGGEHEFGLDMSRATYAQSAIRMVAGHTVKFNTGPKVIVANSTGVNSTANTLKVTDATTFFTVGDKVLYQVSDGQTPITGLSNNAYYYVSFANSTDIAVSATEGGANINITALGVNQTHLLYPNDDMLFYGDSNRSMVLGRFGHLYIDGQVGSILVNSNTPGGWLESSLFESKSSNNYGFAGSFYVEQPISGGSAIAARITANTSANTYPSNFINFYTNSSGSIAGSIGYTNTNYMNVYSTNSLFIGAGRNMDIASLANITATAININTTAVANHNMVANNVNISSVQTLTLVGTNANIISGGNLLISGTNLVNVVTSGTISTTALNSSLVAAGNVEISAGNKFSLSATDTFNLITSNTITLTPTNTFVAGPFSNFRVTNTGSVLINTTTPGGWLGSALFESQTNSTYGFAGSFYSGHPISGGSAIAARITANTSANTYPSNFINFYTNSSGSIAASLGYTNTGFLNLHSVGSLNFSATSRIDIGASGNITATAINANVSATSNLNLVGNNISSAAVANNILSGNNVTISTTTGNADISAVRNMQITSSNNIILAATKDITASGINANIVASGNLLLTGTSSINLVTAGVFNVVSGNTTINAVSRYTLYTPTANIHTTSSTRIKADSGTANAEILLTTGNVNINVSNSIYIGGGSQINIASSNGLYLSATREVNLVSSNTLLVSGTNLANIVSSNTIFLLAGQTVNVVSSNTISIIGTNSVNVISSNSISINPTNTAFIGALSNFKVMPSGYVLVNSTGANSWLTTAVFESIANSFHGYAGSFYSQNETTGAGIAVRITNSGASSFTTRYINFYSNSSGTPAGSISATNFSTVAYNTSSDYRLKINIKPIEYALNSVMCINPVSYNWKEDNTYGEGVIAHELQEIVPYAVVGEKDAIDENGNIIPQQVDYSKLVPMLIKAIQELKQELDEYKRSHS